MSDYLQHLVATTLGLPGTGSSWRRGCVALRPLDGTPMPLGPETGAVDPVAPALAPPRVAAGPPASRPRLPPTKLALPCGRLAGGLARRGSGRAASPPAETLPAGRPEVGPARRYRRAGMLRLRLAAPGSAGEQTADRGVCHAGSRPVPAAPGPPAAASRAAARRLPGRPPSTACRGTPWVEAIVQRVEVDASPSPSRRRPSHARTAAREATAPPLLRAPRWCGSGARPLRPRVITVAREPLPAGREPPPEPIIQVTIGRIRVRATPARRPSTPAAAGTGAIELEDYLRQRARGRAMSNEHAIATNTATLRNLLDRALDPASRSSSPPARSTSAGNGHRRRSTSSSTRRRSTQLAQSGHAAQSSPAKAAVRRCR